MAGASERATHGTVDHGAGRARRLSRKKMEAAGLGRCAALVEPRLAGGSSRRRFPTSGLPTFPCRDTVDVVFFLTVKPIARIFIITTTGSV